MHSTSPLGEFDDAMLDRLHAGLSHPMPGDPTFLSHLGTIGRALIAFERRYRQATGQPAETHPEPTSDEQEAEARAKADDAAYNEDHFDVSEKRGRASA